MKSCRSRVVLTSLCVLGFALGGALPAEAQCLANTGAKGTPKTLWGTLEPTDVQSVPDARDTTEYVGGNQETSFKHPLFSSVDVEEGYAFTSYAFGFMVWDLNNGNAPDPKQLATRDQSGPDGCGGPTSGGDFLVNIGCQEQRWLMWDVDAPAGNSDLVAVAGLSPFGISIWDTSNKKSPEILYQDTARTARAVYATTIGNRAYAFLAASETGSGLHVYDMTAALENYGDSTGCADDSSARPACGVYRGRLGTDEVYQYVDGFTTSGGRTFVAASAGFATGWDPGVTLWEVSNPTAPRDVLKGGRLFSSERIEGVALWEQGGKQYLAVQSANSGSVRIHDVSKCLDGGCANPPQVWTSGPWPVSVRPYVKFVTYSQGPGGAGYLYVGTLNSCIDEVQGEWLYSLQNLASTGPEELTPDQTITLDGKEVGYWSHYYGSRSSGFNRVTPRVGKVFGDHFYRAAWTLFDVHRLKDLGPTIALSATPEEQFAGSGTEHEVKLTASASNCDGGAGLWAWDLAGGTMNEAKSSFDATSSTVYATWTSAGTKDVSVTNDGCTGAEATAKVTILDPSPKVGSVSASTTDAVVCQVVTFTAEGVSGEPPLSLKWTVQDPNGTLPNVGCDPAVTQCGEVFELNTGELAADTYTATVEVSNDSGADPAAAVSPQVTLQDPDPLAIDSGPTTGVPDFGTVQFSATTAGAATWTWDFGDGTEETFHTKAEGESPSHTYTETGTKTVTLTVDNCKETAKTGQTEVTIIEVDPLEIESFLASQTDVFCFSGTCFADAGKEIDFNIAVSGTPESWNIQWDDGTSDQGNGSPPASVSHTYTPGEYQPVLTLSRGTQEKSATHFALDVSEPDSTPPPPPPSPSPPPSPPPPSGDGLEAAFTVTPSDPKVGDEVTFDASPSSGSSLAYFWEFGDGTTSIDKVATHVFEEPGTYSVKLSISQKGCLSGGCPNDNTKRNVKVGGGLVATFETSAECIADFGFNQCNASTGQQVTFTGTTEGAGNHHWDFGDGTQKTGKVVTHAWREPDGYTVTYTARKGEVSGSIDRTFQITGDPISKVQAVVLPWIAQAGQGTALPQSSDLDVHNTGDDPLRLRIVFRKRGLPESEPPSVEVTIPPRATRHFPDALKELLGVERNLSGFLFMEVLEGSGKPVVSSVNRTFAQDGRIFGQVVPGFALTTLPAPVEEGGAKPLHLVGLNDTPDRLSYFGITNPAHSPLSYRLRFYDKFGDLQGETDEPEVIARLGQKQYQVEELRERFGIADLADFRVEILPEEGSPPPFVYAANLRLVSKDPSFLRVGKTDADEVFLLGTLNSPGLNNSFFESDVVLGNVASGPAQCSLTYTPAGVFSDPTEPLDANLPPGETLRLENIVSEWDARAPVGVLRVQCDAEDGLAPVIQGESYDISRPPEVYGQFMPALTTERAARPGVPHSLVGLSQDEKTRTTLWLYNPSDEEVAEYALRYFDLQGNELGGDEELRLGAGKFRQINPGHHPEEVSGEFVVRIELTRGALLTAAQVVNEANDPAYVIGQ